MDAQGVFRKTKAKQEGRVLISMKGVYKTYEMPAGDFHALRDVDFSAKSGEFIAIVGKSGSGKTTLINMITGIDKPSAGKIYCGTNAVHEMDQEQLSVWRGNNVGVIFQFFQLLPSLTVAENIMLPMDFCNRYPAFERRARALNLLEKVDIPEQADKLPADLSGGQMQRAAIARALANDPAILVADEPTGNLDTHTANSVMELFSDLSCEGKTIIMVTHERGLTRHYTRTITLEDGVIKSGQGL